MKSKLPAGVTHSFVIRKISLRDGARSFYVRVLLFESKEVIVKHWATRNAGDLKATSGMLGFFDRSETGRSLGDICVVAGSRKLPWIILHEAYHAAFQLAALHKFRNDGYFPPVDYEEFVVRAGEYITEQALRHLFLRLT